MNARPLSLIASLATVALVSSFVEQSAAAQDRPQRGARPEGAPLKVGDDAPSFTLQSLDEKETFELDAIRAERPVILIFGSYT